MGDLVAAVPDAYWGGEKAVKFLPLVETSMVVLFAITATGLCIWGYIRAKKKPGSDALLTWIRRLLISAVVVVALMGPAIPQEELKLTSNVELVFAVDRTGSMAAEDGPGGEPRLDAVRRDIVSILESTVGARYAVVTWDASARVELPFTTDASAVEAFADVLHQEITEFSAGSLAERPVKVLHDLLESAAEQRPENVRYLIVISDGETMDAGGGGTSGNLDWSSLGSLIDGGVVLGYGTAEGGPMRSFTAGGGGTGDYITDPDSPENPEGPDGEPLAISRIDEDALKGVAGALDVPLLVNPTESDLETLGEKLMADASMHAERKGSRDRYRYIVWAPGIALGLLLVLEVSADASRAARLRRSGAI